MTGEHKIIVQTKGLKYEFTIRRNITVITGNSATGKTTLVSMIASAEDGGNVGVQVICDKKCVTLRGAGWLGALGTFKDTIVFIDEGAKFVHTEEFSKAVKNSDNYYVIVTREPLEQLPYSVVEIYGIRESSKYGGITRTYNETYNIYSSKRVDNSSKYKIHPELIITEDSNSGNDFFREYCNSIGAECISAHGKSNVFDLVSSFDRHRDILAIVDGAAFGSEMSDMMELLKNMNAKLYAPESFEWIILHSGVVNDVSRNMLENPSSYIDSSKYFSWERYFTSLLISVTEHTPFKYTKSKLNRAFLSAKVMRRIIQDIGFLNFPSEKGF